MTVDVLSRRNVAKLVINDELFYDDDMFSFTAMGDADVISLFFSADFYGGPDDEDFLSTYTCKSDSLGTTVSIPAAAAEDIYNALGCILDK